MKKIALVVASVTMALGLAAAPADAASHHGKHVTVSQKDSSWPY